jgi:hypothetical protein
LHERLESEEIERAVVILGQSVSASLDELSSLCQILVHCHGIRIIATLSEAEEQYVVANPMLKFSDLAAALSKQLHTNYVSQAQFEGVSIRHLPIHSAPYLHESIHFLPRGWSLSCELPGVSQTAPDVNASALRSTAISVTQFLSDHGSTGEIFTYALGNTSERLCEALCALRRSADKTQPSASVIVMDDSYDLTSVTSHGDMFGDRMHTALHTETTLHFTQIKV